MKISTKGRYALRLMIDLAQHEDEGFVALKDIAERQEISLKYLEQIVTVMSRSGLIRSLRGSQGGYMLAKTPEQYRVGEILRAIEGSLAPVACLDDEENQCPRRGICGTLPFWQGLFDVVNEYVDSVSLADLAGVKK